MKFNFLVNQESYLRTTEFLADQMRKKGYAWQTGKMKPMDSILFTNRQIEVGGTQQLLTGSTLQERGVTNFDGNKLTKGRVFVANAISFGFKVDTTGKSVHSVAYNYGEVPAYLEFANIVIKQKDEILLKIPVGSIYRASNDRYAKSFMSLGGLVLIEDDTPIEYEIEFPQGIDAGLPDGQSLYITSQLKGLETYLKR